MLLRNLHWITLFSLSLIVTPANAALNTTKEREITVYNWDFSPPDPEKYKVVIRPKNTQYHDWITVDLPTIGNSATIEAKTEDINKINITFNDVGIAICSPSNKSTYDGTEIAVSIHDINGALTCLVTNKLR